MTELAQDELAFLRRIVGEGRRLSTKEIGSRATPTIRRSLRRAGMIEYGRDPTRSPEGHVTGWGPLGWKSTPQATAVLALEPTP